MVSLSHDDEHETVGTTVLKESASFNKFNDWNDETYFMDWHPFLT